MTAKEKIAQYKARYAQAKAVTEGCRTRLVFDQLYGRYFLEFAPDEVEGRFERIGGLAGRTFRLPEDVVLSRIRLLAADGVTRAETLTFFPDGSGGLGTIRLAGSVSDALVTVTERLGRVEIEEI